MFIYKKYRPLIINFNNYRSVFDYNPFYWNLVPIIILYKYVTDK